VNLSQLLSGWLLPPSVSTYGPQLDSIYYFILWVTGIIFVLTEAALIGFAIRYRYKKGRQAHYTHGNTVIEIVWTTIPALLLIYMGIISQDLWAQIRQPSRFPANASVVKVLAEQWLWQFTYPGDDKTFDTDDDVTVNNNFHIPVNTPIRFEARALDVIHGFYLPDFRVHQNIVPGLTTPIWVEGNKTGTYELRCTQFCGTNHYEMKGLITVDTPEDYKAWLASVKAEAF
jgi:cytochrome c oxidase subunit II